MQWREMTRRMMWVAVLIVTAGCEDEEVDPLPDQHEESSVAVVFEADFLDVYGPIELRVQGEEPLSLEHDGQFDCEAPALRLRPGTAFEARSTKNFLWEGIVPEPVNGEGCALVRLDSKGLAAGVVGIFQNDTDCLPADVWFARVSVRPEEQLIGVIEEPWTYDARDFDPPPYADPTLFLLKMARAKKVVVFGGGDVRDIPPLWARRVSRQEGCKQMTWEVGIPRDNQRMLFGRDPRDDHAF